VKVFDLNGQVKCLDCQTSQLTFDSKLETIGSHFCWYFVYFNDYNNLVELNIHCVQGKSNPLYTLS